MPEDIDWGAYGLVAEMKTVNGPAELEILLDKWEMPMFRVPVSKFCRELRKWIRYVENTGMPIIVTQRFGPEVVFMKVVDTDAESV